MHHISAVLAEYEAATAKRIPPDLQELHELYQHELALPIGRTTYRDDEEAWSCKQLPSIVLIKI